VQMARHYFCYTIMLSYFNHYLPSTVNEYAATPIPSRTCCYLGLQLSRAS
jgi:hypothetical protein